MGPKKKRRGLSEKTGQLKTSINPVQRFEMEAAVGCVSRKSQNKTNQSGKGVMLNMKRETADDKYYTP